MQVAERAHNFVVDFCLQTTSTVVEVLRCRSPFRSLPSRLIHQKLMQMRCRTVAVHLLIPVSLGNNHPCCWNPMDLFEASHWLERSSSRFSVTLLVFSRADHSTLQVLTTFYVVFISTFYWRLGSKALQLIRPPADWSTAVTSHAAVNSDARSPQVSSQSIRVHC